MGFRIITDSASDMPQETAAKLGVTVMPIHTRFGDEEYLDGVTLKPREFFEKLVETDEIPRTSQITPYEFGQEFEKWISAGDGVLCITMSAGVSGTYQSACAAAAEYGDRVIVIDSRQFCISLYVLVEYACRLRDEGKTLEETAKEEHITKIGSVTLEIGEVSGIMTDLFTDCWDYFKTRHPVLRDSELRIVKIPAVTFCNGCGQTYETVRYGKECPYCHSGETWLVDGNQCMIREIEAETEEEDPGEQYG